MQIVEGYDLDMNETDINATSGPVFQPPSLDAAVVPRSSYAQILTELCAAFRVPIGACSSPYGCELLIIGPSGFMPEDQFCGTAFQRRLLECHTTMVKICTRTFPAFFPPLHQRFSHQ